ncbi:MAG TPA: DUF3551 domain-containing protein [Pseudolabrys sp.]|nr:DUF3551 domain-containing protein [Pseudolabrys sp.]
MKYAIMMMALLSALAADMRTEAEAGKFCSRGSSSYSNCGFDTFEQCMENTLGMEAGCGINPSEVKPGDEGWIGREPLPREYRRQRGSE